jgi:ribosome recycling factor
MIDEIIAETREHMEHSVDALRRDLATIRTGRASVNLLDGIRIDYYGTQTPLNQVAILSVPEPRLILVKPWEQHLIADIEKAIRSEASLGLNPGNDGTVIRIPIPELTEERRRDITKVARHRAEEGRVAIRHGRRDGLDLLADAKKGGEVSEDEARHAQESIQQLTEEFIGQLDGIIAAKEKEIMVV